MNDSKSNTWSYQQIGNYWDDYSAQYPKSKHNGTVWNSPYAINGSKDIVVAKTKAGKSIIAMEKIDATFFKIFFITHLLKIIRTLQVNYKRKTTVTKC